MDRNAIGLSLERLELPAGEVHVWSASLSVSPVALAAHTRCLSPDETRRASSFVFERHRNRFIAGRAFLRVLLGAYIRRSPERVQFAYGPHGKPELGDGAEVTGLKFNLSHSGDVALCAVTLGREVGVDVEEVRDLHDARGVANRFFSPAENAVLQDMPEGARLAAFFTCWTRKEAFLKALGDGLARPLDAFDVTLAPGAPARLLRVADRPDEAERWSLCDVAVGPGFAAALAVDGHGWRLRRGAWPSSPDPEVADRADDDGGRAPGEAKGRGRDHGQRATLSGAA